jgi:hypothetical protein
MSKICTKLCAAAVTAIFALALAPSGGAHHMVLRFNLEEMTATADRVFVGRCSSVEETREMIAQGMLPVTIYTFNVERVIKGRIPAVFTFRQLGHTGSAKAKGDQMTIHGQAAAPQVFHGMTDYRVGDRLVLFLIPDYLGGKVTYPVGLYQGAFYVSDMPSGQQLVRNNINNLGLFTAPYNGYSVKSEEARVVFPERDQPIGDISTLNLSAEAIARKRGSLPLEDFLNLIEQIVVARGGQKGALIQ